jgi:hypothetical protein
MKPPKLPVRLLAAIILVFQIYPTFAAQGDWQQSAKDTYVARCSKSMIKNGLPTDKATGYCRCAVDGLEVEYGKKDYDAMMRARPNPQGTDADRRLYKVLKGCSQWLPQ